MLPRGRPSSGPQRSPAAGPWGGSHYERRAIGSALHEQWPSLTERDVRFLRGVGETIMAELGSA